jgi:ABC-type branched-subunit amino acid transport system substrate-binding protein
MATAQGRLSTTAFIAGILITALVVGGATYLLTAQPGAPVEEELPPIKIGHILPFSGPLSAYAEGFANGVRLAVQEINDAGGIAGRKVELIEEDTATDPSTAAEAARKLIEVDGVKAIIGAYASSSTLAAAPIAEKNKVILISPASTSPLVSEAGEYIFRVVPSDAFQGRALAELAYQLGYRRAATIVIDNQYGVGIEEVFKQVFESLGGQVVATVRYKLDQATYRTELGQIKAANPDVIIDVSYADDGQIIFREARELGIEVPWLAAEGVADPAIFGAPGVAEAMEGMMGTKPAPPATSAHQHFLQLYARYGYGEPGIYSAEAYDAARMALLAISLAGPDASPEQLRDALIYVSRTYVGASGDKSFDENGDVTGQYIIWRVVNGEFVTVGSWDLVSGVQLQE